jgi:hypothetical protein
VSLPTTEKKKKRELTEKQELFLHYLASDAKGDLRAAAKLAGYSDHTTMNEIMGNLIEEIKEIADKLIATNAVKAVFGITDTLDNPAQIGAQHKLNAAKEILDRVGIVKKDVTQTQQKTGGAVFFLPEKDGKVTITIEQESNNVIDITPIDKEDESH